MGIVDLLTNAVGGGVVGTVLHLATDWVSTRNKIALMKAQTESAEKVEAWKAFANAQEGSSTPFVVPDSVYPWVSSLYVLVEALKCATRPLLTYCLVGLLAGVYATATPEVRGQMTPELTFGGFTAIFFWYGSRYTRK
jgi:hypothetical protein